MPKKYLFLLIAGVIILVAFAVAAISFRHPAMIKAAGSRPVSQVCFAKNCFSVELAITPMQQETGLMYRTSMDQNKGMLFVFPSQDMYSFWMKNTLIPLDMVWLDQNKNVVYIAANAPPCKTNICAVYTPTAKASYVIEINAGAAAKEGITVGSQATFK
jgi:uncharacterized membrane protein (UPF0127 family)